MKYIIPILFLIAFGTSCHTIKKSTVTRDSVVIKFHDSTVTNNVTLTRDSVIIHDSIVTIEGENTGFSFPFDATTDTVVKKGGLTLRRTVNKGVVTIECDAEKKQIIINNLTKVISFKDKMIEVWEQKYNEATKSHSDVTVKEETKSWFGRLWANVQKFFAWFGLVCFVALVVWLVMKIVK